MVSLRNLALAASAVVGITSAHPAEKATRQSTVPESLNSTQEFYIRMSVTAGPTTYDGWALSAYHTGAGFADPVFGSTPVTPAFLNGTFLQFNVGDYPFSMIADSSDSNYARWEPVTIEVGYGSGQFVYNDTAGFQVDNDQSDGWIVCEWYHGDDAPQLFQMIVDYDSAGGLSPITDIPSSCSRVLLFPELI